MKKTLMLVLVMALAFSCFAAVLTAGASTEIVQGTKSEQGNYFMTETKMPTVSWDFSSIPSNVAKRFDTTPALEIVDGALKATTHQFEYALQTWYYETNTVYVSSQTYYVEFDVKVNENTNGIAFLLHNGWGVMGNGSGASEAIGINVTHGEDGNVSYSSVTVDKVGGWPDYPDVTNGSLKVTKLENGFDRIYVEFTPRTDLTNNAQMVVCYNDANVTGNHDILTDNFSHGTVIAPKYYTIDWDYDYNGLTDVAQAWDQQPVWAQVSGELDENYVDGTQCIKLNVGASASNTVIGGLDQAAANIDGKKLVKYAALTYFQYDIFVDNCTMVNIWSSVQYSAVMFNGEAWHGEGAVVGFKATALESGAYRISYFIDMTENRDMDFNINASSTDGGAVYIDNLVVAHEDYSAYLKSTAMYNLVGTADVSLDFDAKGKEVTSVKLDDVALTADDYTIADGKLTIKAGKIATTELGKNHTLSVVTTGSETPVTATISQIDNRPEVTASYSGKALEAVTYNGTTNYNGTITLTLTGVADGDVVTVSGTAALASKNAGATKVVITNLVLAGADAYKYKLANESVEIDITVNALQLTIGQATVADKTYDGTTTANVTAGTLVGVLEGDNVTVIASGVFDSKDVASATKVTVTYTIAGDDAANYIAPVASEVAKTISKASATVTAKAATKQESAADPELKYDVTGLVEGDALTGALARDKGETAGEYNITIGTLANSNYEITFTGAKLTITAKPAEDKPAEDKGCFGVVGAASVAVFAVAVAAVAVVCKRKED